MLPKNYKALILLNMYYKIMNTRRVLAIFNQLNKCFLFTFIHNRNLFENFHANLIKSNCTYLVLNAFSTFITLQIETI